MRYRPMQLVVTLFIAAITGVPGKRGDAWWEARAFACSSASEREMSCNVVGGIPYWAQDEAMRSFEANRESIDAISMFWYHLDPQGEVLEYDQAEAKREIVEDAQEHGVKVLALVANLPDDEREGEGLTWDADRVARVIQFQKNRQAHIAELVALTRRMGFDGIHIDYEGLPEQYRGEFTLFIQQLGAALHEEDKMLAVALHAKTAEDDPSENNGSWAQDWAALQEHVDQLHFMTYSQHTGETEPGPVAALGWTEGVLRYAVKEVGIERSKVYMGLPLYAEGWHEKSSGEYRGEDEDLTFSDVQERKQAHGGKQDWSREHASPNLTYIDDEESERVLWFENGRSVARKLRMARELGVCNVALWRLGDEDPAIWRALRGFMGVWKSESGEDGR